MIREIFVNGYRSLSEITIPLEEGLNIFVGPNGGGKTNILSFFEFLSKIADDPIDEAVSSHGGIGRVFTRVKDNKFQTNLDTTISGSINVNSSSKKDRILWYTWKFKIVSSDSYDEIKYEYQRLYIHFGQKPKNMEKYDLIIGTRRTENGTFLKIERMIITRLQAFFRRIHFSETDNYINKSEAVSNLRIADRYVDLSSHCMIAGLVPVSSHLRLILDDLRSKEIFNISPDICKRPDDSSRPPVLEKNGSGLASTLYHLEKSSEELNRFMRRQRQRLRNPHKKRLKIKSFVKLIGSEISDIYTRKNPIDNTISIYLSIKEEKGDVAFPLSQCSDGTVKWIALLTKIFVSEQGFSIEEPENFLHPLVQKEFINVAREESQRSENNPYTLITTHSESLLNEANPEEVVIVWMEQGKTHVRRVLDPDILRKEINRTGFGLGYYYTTGVLGGA